MSAPDRTGQVWTIEQDDFFVLVVGPPTPRVLNAHGQRGDLHPAVSLLDGGDKRIPELVSREWEQIAYMTRLL